MKNEDGKKRILFLSPFFYPELISTGKYNTHLVKKLVEAGSSVSVITSHPLYPDWKAKFSDDQLPGAEIIRGGLHIKYPGSAVLRRLVLEVWFAFFTVRKVVKLRNSIDIVVSIFPPNLVFVFVKLVLPRHVSKVGVIHDIQGVMAESTKSYFRKLVATAIGALEKIVINGCDKVVCLSESMRKFLVETYKIPGDKCVIHYPFVTNDSDGEAPDGLSKIFPDDFRHVVYSGALGEKQKPRLLLELFRNITSKDPKVMCHIFSGGPLYKELKQESEKLGTEKIIFHDLVAEAQIKNLYKHSSIQIVPQAEGTSAGAFPSKLPNLLASGVPIFVICDSESELSKLMRDVKTVHLEHSWDMKVNSTALLGFMNEISSRSHEECIELNRECISKKFDSEELVHAILSS